MARAKKKPVSGAVGRIFIRRGNVVSARLDERNVEGRQSVYEMLRWRAGAFSFAATLVDMEDTIQTSTTHLLMEGARLIDEAIARTPVPFDSAGIGPLVVRAAAKKKKQ